MSELDHFEVSVLKRAAEVANRSADDNPIVILTALKKIFDDLSEKNLDPVCELFGTGGPGTLSHSSVSGTIEWLRTEHGLDEPPLPVGWWSRAIKAYSEARSSGADPVETGKEFAREERSL
jgi:hypothetical protein